MRFDEIPVYRAVRAAFANTDKPCSGDDSGNVWPERWLFTMQFWVTTAQDDDVPPSMSQVRAVWLQMRKSGGEKLKLTVDVGNVHGWQCAYKNRGVGDCSETVDLDRITPDSRGGQYTVENCQIACALHNRSRGDKPIEAYLEHRLPVEKPF